MPALWSFKAMFPRLSPGRTNDDTDYRFYNPFTSRFISEGDATVVLRGMDRCMPSGHPVGWDYSEINAYFVA